MSLLLQTIQRVINEKSIIHEQLTLSLSKIEQSHLLHSKLIKIIYRIVFVRVFFFRVLVKCINIKLEKLEYCFLIK